MTVRDKSEQTVIMRVAVATLGDGHIDNKLFENTFDYLGSDGDDEADVCYRMDIAQAAFTSLFQLCLDHRISRNMKLRLYHLSVCATSSY